jgi:hypothetical protein
MTSTTIPDKESNETKGVDSNMKVSCVGGDAVDSASSNIPSPSKLEQEEQEQREAVTIPDKESNETKGVDSNMKVSCVGGDAVDSASSNILSPSKLKQEEQEQQEAVTIPGQILYVHKDVDGRLIPTVLLYADLKPFLGIQRISVDAIEDHHMKRHLSSLRNLRGLHRGEESWGKVRRSSGTREISRHCAVCKSDPIWPYIFQSDGFRACGAQSCAQCGIPVCVVCGPAGDEIRGEGFSETAYLPDNRIPLPSIGKFEPQRVCTPCFLNAYSF